MSSFVLNLSVKGHALQQQKTSMGPTVKVMSTVQEKKEAVQRKASRGMGERRERSVQRIKHIC